MNIWLRNDILNKANISGKTDTKWNITLNNINNIEENKWLWQYLSYFDESILDFYLYFWTTKLNWLKTTTTYSLPRCGIYKMYIKQVKFK